MTLWTRRQALAATANCLAASYPVTYRGRAGRDARSGGYIAFDMKVKPGALLLQATYWGEERDRVFDILIDDRKLATQVLQDDRPGQFFDAAYAVPEAWTQGRQTVRLRFAPHDGHTAGPIFGVRVARVLKQHQG